MQKGALGSVRNREEPQPGVFKQVTQQSYAVLPNPWAVVSPSVDPPLLMPRPKMVVMILLSAHAA